MRGAARPAAGSGGTGRSEGCFQGGSWQASAPALAGPPARPGGPSGRKSRPGNSPRPCRKLRFRQGAAPPPHLISKNKKIFLISQPFDFFIHYIIKQRWSNKNGQTNCGQHYN